MKHPKIIVKYRNSLEGYRPIEWRYLNSGWRTMGGLLNRNLALYMFVVKEYGQLRREEGGKLKAPFFENLEYKRSGGDFHVPYVNCLTSETVW